MAEYIINDSNFETAAAPPGFSTVTEAVEVAQLVGQNRFGLTTPTPMKCKYRRLDLKALNMDVIPRDEWLERIEEGWAKESFLVHYRRRGGPNGGFIPSQDQNGQGFCWMYGAVAQIVLLRAAQNLKYVPLSPHSAACRVKNFRDEGGWNALAIEHLMEFGVSDAEHWPLKSMSRSNDTPESRENALKYRPREAWVDLSASVYDRNLTEDQRVTCLLLNCPVGADRYRWSHSTVDMSMKVSSRARRKKSLLKTRFQDLDFNDPKDLEIFFATFSTVGWNSWTDNWGDRGEFTMEGNQQKMDGGTAITSVIAA